MNVPLGQNIKVNYKYAIFPSQVTDGGVLGVIASNSKLVARQNSVFLIQFRTKEGLYKEILVAKVFIGAPDGKVFIGLMPDNVFDGGDKKNHNACNPKVEINKYKNYSMKTKKRRYIKLVRMLQIN